MIRVDELIEQLCPDGVEFVELRMLAEIGTGSSDRKDAVENGAYPFYVRSREILAKEDYEYDEEAVIIPGEGGIGEIFHYVNGPYALHQRVYRIHITDNRLNTKFLKRYMESSFRSFILKKAVSATVTSIRKPMIQQFPVPVPPMEVQQEIVRVLDSFAELDAELDAELEAEQEARSHQFAYYRDELFEFDNRDDVQWMKLGDVGAFTRGSSIQKKDFTSSGVGCIHYGQLYTHYGIKAQHTKSFISSSFAEGKRMAKQGDLVIATTSENEEDVCKAVAWLGKEDIAVSNDAYIFRHSLEPRYVSYFFSCGCFQEQKKALITGTKVLRVSGDGMSKIVIPVPPFEEQVQIADILDSYDALVKDLLRDLSAEIETRRKQYAYYRDKLLSFKEKVA